MTDQLKDALMTELAYCRHNDLTVSETAERAFEERERKLREQLARYEGGAGPDDWRECPGQCGESCCGYHEVCRQALKETPDAQ